MRPDVHAAALRSAAKLVFSMASLAVVNTGCSSAEPTDDTGANDSAVITAGTKGKGEGEKGAGTGTAAPQPTGCAATLATAFPGPDHYQWKPVPVSAEVVACCDEYFAGHVPGTSHRWACCVAFDPNAAPVTPSADAKADANAETPATFDHFLACTPWGPPVPPSMKRRDRRAPKSKARRDMNAFLAQALVS